MDSDRDELLQTFMAEAHEILDEIERALLQLETGRNVHDVLQRVFRATHTLKGSAGSMGLGGLSDLGHAAEDVIEALCRGDLSLTTAVVSLLLETVDAARRLVAEVEKGQIERSTSHREVVARLQEARRGGLETAEDVRGTSARRATEDDAEEATSIKSIRVAVEKLDRMADLVGELTLGRNRIARKLHAARGEAGAALRDEMEEQDRLCKELDEAVRAARMVPVGPWFRHYERTVRDLAHAHGRQARLFVVHGDVEVDTAVIERFRDALTHLLRNAICHGIEAPEARRAAGKDPCGTITLHAAHERGGIALRIADDGAGMSRERIAAQVRAQGRHPAPDALPDHELFSLVFEPGFSTAAESSHLAGRGMGMDVVRRRVESIQGTIRIESREGRGTSLSIQLPLTLATIEGLSVGIDDERYVIPLRSVLACCDLPRGTLAHGGTQGLMVRRGRALPCVRLRALFRLDGPPPPDERVVIVAHEGSEAGLVVDTLDGEGRTVVKPLGQLFRRVPGISGSTLLGDGSVAMILDVDALLGRVLRELGPAFALGEGTAAPAAAGGSPG
ncbi:chemotaxis protein CheA [Sorangium cellulosum]|uniref:Chemotaxis protein CheA n=1 Tax=Sorangium cellulosum TaxID=56 RepID=A0A2L0EHB4_SORCE|nr:chemotaxis protein CheA [Sorangium cellulosum]AUX38682.1 chemotaxis protein CheA [Sorangium cellulosum]